VLKLSVDCSRFDPIQHAFPRCPAAQLCLNRGISAAVREQLPCCDSNKLGLEMELDPKVPIHGVSTLTMGMLC